MCSILPASLFCIACSWTLSHSPWESHLLKKCFPICMNTGGYLFRHALCKICKEGLPLFFPYGISKTLRKYLWSPAKLSQPNHMGRSSVFKKNFYLNNKVVLEGELLTFLAPEVKYLILTNLHGRRIEGWKVWCLSWPGRCWLACPFSVTFFFPFSLIFRFNVDEISIELLNFLNIENTQILNGSIRNSEFLLAWIILSRGILFIFPEGYFLRNHLGVYWCLLHISNEGSVNVKLWSSTVKAELWNKL